MNGQQNLAKCFMKPQWKGQELGKTGPRKCEIKTTLYCNFTRLVVCSVLHKKKKILLISCGL